MMFLINTWVALAALAVGYVIYKYIQRSINLQAGKDDEDKSNQVKGTLLYALSLTIKPQPQP